MEGPNAIVLENRRRGTTSWEITRGAGFHRLAGYASSTSVMPGSTIQFMVSTTAPSFKAHVYRMGWYGGSGGRLVRTLDHIVGHHWPVPPPDVQTGMVACQWPAAFSITIPPMWLSGIYLVKLIASTGYQAYVPFVVREAVPTSTYVLIHPVATDQAYNAWGGKSFYGDSHFPNWAESFPARAVEVSYDRPFDDGYGAGDFFYVEDDMVLWLERRGYDVSYLTDLDVNDSLGALIAHRAMIIAGHDEYWSEGMRDHIEAAVAQDVSLAVFSANTSYWQIRLEPLDGARDRVEICFKVRNRDPMLHIDPALVTVRWRDAPVNRPESALLGAAYGGRNADRELPLVIKDAGSWAFAGTGLRAGDRIPNVVGPEYDTLVPGLPVPPHLDVLTATPEVNAAGAHMLANATVYHAASGAWVFNAGSTTWPWALHASGRQVSAASHDIPPRRLAVEVITENILRRLAG